jgi:aminoglycoside phosphotransferase family enzyme
MTTWMQVMALVRRLDDKRVREGRIGDSDAQQLVAMILDFHKQTVARPPSGEMNAVTSIQEDRARAAEAGAPSQDRIAGTR